MKNKCIIIPLENSSNFSPRYERYVNKTSTNKKLSGHMSFDTHSNLYQKNPHNPSYSNNNDFLCLKRSEIFPSINTQDSRREYCDIQTHKSVKYSESDTYEEKINSSSYKPYLNNSKLFNGNKNMLIISQNNNDYNNVEKNRANYTYYESKYSKKNSTEKINIKPNKKEATYNKENYNLSNISSNQIPIKNSRIDSNFSIGNEMSNSNYKKRIANIPNNKKNLTNSNNKNNDKKRIIYINSQNIINSNRKNKNDLGNNKIKNIYHQNSSSNHLETFKDSYCSPIKKIKTETIYDNNSKIERNLPNKSLDKESYYCESNKVINKNKKIETIKENKSKIIELKKFSSIALKKIPFSPKEKTSTNSIINKIPIKINFSNYKDANNNIKNNYSFTTIKTKDSVTNLDKTNGLNEKSKDAAIKGIKLTHNKTFKKSISTEINSNFNFKSFERGNSLNLYKSKLKTIEVENKSSNKENNNNKKANLLNINHSNYIDNNPKKDNKRNDILNRLKKGKKELLIGDNNDYKLIRRLHSQQRLNFHNGIIDEKKNTSNSKINALRNNLVNSSVIEQNQRFTNDISLNKIYDNNNNFSKKNNSKTNVLFSTNNFSNNNNYSNNHINSVTINKINPSFLESNQRLTSNKNISNTINAQSQKQKTKRYLSEIPKYQTRTNINQVSDNKNDDDEEDWDDKEFLGLRKKTYDPARRQKKNHNKNNPSNLIKNTFLPSEIFTQPTFIKSCESITVPGRKENGNKKINQDSYIIERNINGILNFNIFGVLDGHGEDGHYASQFVSRYMITHIKNNPLIKKCEDAKEIYEKLTQNGYHIIANLFTDVDIQIQKEKFDCKNSGTTCVIVIQLEDKIICANTGDSRAIMIFDKSKDDNLVNSKIYPLSYDCKPELPNERKRIYEFGGVVEKAFDDNEEEGGPYRVWAYGEDYPGLAMSRSIGDMDAKKLGVIPNPQIIEYNINENTKYMLICSDGIWEFINNEEAMKIGNKFYLRNDAMGLCQELYKKSVDLWLKEEIVIDDITAIAVFF
jgi:serine/threonine protein phosphatase PrpC